MSKPPLISASILAGNLANLGKTVQQVDHAGVDWIHLDVMDGHFVPNLTFGPPVVKALRPHSNKLFDTHLMMTNPDDHVAAFAEAGADLITLHLEVLPDIRKSLNNIKKLGKRSGLSIKPSTPASALANHLGDVDLILVMTVEPGFAGQAHLDQSSKIREVAQMIAATGREIYLQVDGGINPQTIGPAVAAGATVAVVGSALFKTEDLRANLAQLKAAF